MSARSPLCRAAFALLWLVGAVPQLAQADSFDVVPLPSLNAENATDSFKLHDCAQLPPLTPRVELPWCRQVDPNAPMELQPQGEVTPHITSVPVAAIVGGSLIASMGITQRVRRNRSIRG